MSHVPGNLRKSSPNFHLLLSSLEHDAQFCKTTMSAMIMNYPPPTIISTILSPGTGTNWEQAKLKSVLAYLEAGKVVKDNDLVMLVDGRNTWFQLPSDIMIRQYMSVVADLTQRVRREYGNGFSQTIVFGARKTCEGDNVACGHVPSSILPKDLYHTGEGAGMLGDILPAQYLDADTVMGPVEDLRKLFRTALLVLDEGKSQLPTIQSAMSTLFAEQTLARRIDKIAKKHVMVNLYDYIVRMFKGSQEHNSTDYVASEQYRQYEFSIGLDYTHALFQPLTECANDELLGTNHRNGTNVPPETLPPAFTNATGPFWRPTDDTSQDPSPNDRPAYIDKLEFRYGLDKLPRRDTLWTDISLIQNTYTGAIPATFSRAYQRPVAGTNQPGAMTNLVDAAIKPHTPSVTWSSLWYSGYERALLRRYFRTPQSPIGYHNAAVGGDLLWDQRGGRGGVWTVESALWLPFGEVDGVCGTYELISNVFEDKKGVWFHEEEDGGGKAGRQREEQALKQHLEEDRKKDEEWAEKLEAQRLQSERLETQRMRIEKEREWQRLDREMKAKAEADKQATADATAAALSGSEMGMAGVVNAASDLAGATAGTQT